MRPVQKPPHPPDASKMVATVAQEELFRRIADDMTGIGRRRRCARDRHPAARLALNPPCRRGPAPRPQTPRAAPPGQTRPDRFRPRTTSTQVAGTGKYHRRPRRYGTHHPWTPRRNRRVPLAEHSPTGGTLQRSPSPPAACTPPTRSDRPSSRRAPCRGSRREDSHPDILFHSRPHRQGDQGGRSRRDYEKRR